MTTINKIDLTEVQFSDRRPSNEEEELKEYSLTDTVSTPEGDGMIAALVEENFTYPAKDGDGDKELEASEENPYYIVALFDEGNVAVTAEDIEGETDFPDDDGEEIESEDKAIGKGSDAELAEVYDHMDDPNDLAELRQVKKDMVQENQPLELGRGVERGDMELSDIEDMSYDELANIRGVDDPEVGFASMPNGWT